jgi:uncharacterized protein YjbI with pentapeptide repeats
MNALESSDRRVILDGEASRDFAQGYFLDETAESVRFAGVKFEGFAVLNSRFEGGQWLSVALKRVDFACVTFRHLYFESVDFSDCTFSGVTFDHCVFAGCRFPTTENTLRGFELLGCHHAFPPSAIENAVPAQMLAQSTETSAAAPLPKAPVATPQDRFDRIER